MGFGTVMIGMMGMESDEPDRSGKNNQRSGMKICPIFRRRQVFAFAGDGVMERSSDL